MSMIDWILLILIGIAVFFAVRKIVRDKKSGRACSSCEGGCPGCGQCEAARKKNSRNTG